MTVSLEFAVGSASMIDDGHRIDRTDDIRAVFDAAEDVPRPDPMDGAQDGGPDDGQGHDAPPPSAPEDSGNARMFEAAKFPLNDYGNGQRVALHFGEDLMFVPRVGWFTWDGTRWAKDPDMLAVRAKAQALAPLILAETNVLTLSDRERKIVAREVEIQDRLDVLGLMREAERPEGFGAEVGALKAELRGIEGALKGHRTKVGRIVTHAKNAGNSGPLQHMLEEGQTLLARALADLDAAPLDVNCETALLRFAVQDTPGEGPGKRAGIEAVPHARDQLQTKKIPVAYDPIATCPRFHAFLEEVQPDGDVRGFLQRWFGLSMTGLPVQRMVFFHGNGANGKSVLVDLMARIMGDYAATVRIESLTGTTRRGGGDATPDLIPLIGARSARTSEPDQGTRLQEALIKELTGGEIIMVRALHADFVEIRPIFKLTMSGNHKPEIRGNDDGIWRRVLMVPWDETIPEDRRNPHLVEELMSEASGILNWLIEGLVEYLEGGLSPPASIANATAEYRRESDPLGLYLAECCLCEGDETESLTTERLKAGFDLWLGEQGMPAWKGRSFSLSLTKRPGTWRHPESGWSFTKGPNSKQSNYIGIRFTGDFRERLDTAPVAGGWRKTASPDPDEGQ